MKSAKTLLSTLSALALFGMMVMIFCALPLASLAGEHIAFDLLDRWLPATLLRWQLALSNALTSVIFALVAWVVWHKAQRTVNMGDITATLEIPIAPFQIAVVAALVLTALAHAVLAWRATRTPQAGAT